MELYAQYRIAMSIGGPSAARPRVGSGAEGSDSATSCTARGAGPCPGSSSRSHTHTTAPTTSSCSRRWVRREIHISRGLLRQRGV